MLLAMIRSVLLLVVLGSTGNAYNILIFHPTPSLSHQLPVMALTEALIEKGHQLFVISPNAVPRLEKSYTYVDVSFAYKYFSDDGKETDSAYLQVQFSKWDALKSEPAFAAIPGKLLNSSAFSQFHKRVKDESIKFDVVLTETFYIPFGCAMSRLLNEHSPPLISVSSMVMDFFGEDYLGSIGHRSFAPAFMDSYTDKMSIWQRIDSWISSAFYIKSKMEAGRIKAAENFFREAYGPESVSLLDGCASNLSLSIVASNFLYYYPRLLGPNVIEVGPLHLKNKTDKLSQNLQDWLDGAEKGVIYFSLGSNMKSKSLPLLVRQNFLRVFGELPAGYRILWKWELDGKIPGQSDNILTSKWTPQQSILAHSKVKVFITQGGLQSFQEAVHYGVPTIGIPWFGDQELDVAKMVDAGIGTRLEPQELHSYEKIKSALEAVLYDESYTKNMRRHSAISQDFTSQALDKAVFWVEHVAKFGGASHLRPSTADSTLFEFFCLDILTVFFITMFSMFYLIRLVFRLLVTSIFSSPTSKIKKN